MHLLCDVFRLGVKGLRKGRTLDANVFFSAGVLANEATSGLGHQPTKVFVKFRQNDGSSAGEGDVHGGGLGGLLYLHRLDVVVEFFVVLR